MNLLEKVFLFSIALGLLTVQLTSAQTIKPKLTVSETIYKGEEFLLKTKLLDEEGNLILNASVKAFAEFFSTELYDDGVHDDNQANDGIYANWVLANASRGTYAIQLAIEKGNFTDTMQLSIKIIEKPRYTILILSGVVILILIIGSFIIYRRGVAKKGKEDRIKQLETKRKNLLDMIERTKEAFYNREMDEKQFSRAIEKYEQEIIRIDVELKNLKKEQK